MVVLLLVFNICFFAAFETIRYKGTKYLILKAIKDDAEALNRKEG